MATNDTTSSQWEDSGPVASIEIYRVLLTEDGDYLIAEIGLQTDDLRKDDEYLIVNGDESLPAARLSLVGGYLIAY